MIFIDEIDAVGMRRQALGGGMGMGLEPTESPFDSPPLYGSWGALNPSGDLILENRAWRERLFAARAEAPADAYPAFVARVRDRVNGFMFPGMGGMGGGMALNQLLVQMDGVDEPPFLRKVFTKRFNTFLDATYLVPAAHRQGARCASARRSRAPSRSTSSAPPTSRSTRSTPRSSARAAWAATSGSARRPRTTARTSSTSTSARWSTTRPSTRPSAATSSRA